MSEEPQPSCVLHNNNYNAPERDAAVRLPRLGAAEFENIISQRRAKPYQPLLWLFPPLPQKKIANFQKWLVSSLHLIQGSRLRNSQAHSIF
jgi:hypothetical protein